MARERVDVGDPVAAAAALQRVCTRVTDNVRYAVAGDDGCSALLARVLAMRRRPTIPS